jgi:hypothetical protein
MAHLLHPAVREHHAHHTQIPARTNDPNQLEQAKGARTFKRRNCCFNETILQETGRDRTAGFKKGKKYV